MAKQHSEDYKISAVEYYLSHKELGYKKCAKNLGVAVTTLRGWVEKYERNNGNVPGRGRGNYSSDEAKENARLRKELQDTKDALEILKKAISILGE